MSDDTSVGLPEVSEFVLLRATEEQLDRIISLVRQRRQNLQEQASAAVKVGVMIELADLKPRYLNGLRGTVLTVTTKRDKTLVTLRLDANSVTQLATSSTKYADAYGQDSYDLPGIPIICCRTVTH